MATKGDRREAQEKQFIILSGPRERESHTQRKGQHGREHQRSKLIQVGGTQERVSLCEHVLLLGVSGEDTRKGTRGFHCCIWVSLGHSQRRTRKGLVAESNLVTLVHLSPERVAHSLSVGVWGNRKMWIFNGDNIIWLLFFSYFLPLLTKISITGILCLSHHCILEVNNLFLAFHVDVKMP